MTVQPSDAQGQPATPAAASLQYQMGHNAGQGGPATCQITLTQGQLQATFLMVPADLAEFARKAAQIAREAGAGGLVIPTMTILPNGHA